MIARRWEAVARLVAEHRDVLDARPGEEQDAPPALVRRGWASFLAALDDDRLTTLEIDGHHAEWSKGTPPSLVALAARARELCALAPLSLASDALRGPGG